MRNLDNDTVKGFGEEWTRFDQRDLDDEEIRAIFDAYFSVFPWDTLPSAAVGFDLGCGSGRWAKLVAARVAKLHCIDASANALAVARANLARMENVQFHHASVDAIPLADDSMDFGYSLGVLHHVPDTRRGIAACVRKLKPGAPLLIYLYYSLDNRPAWFRAIWHSSNLGRKAISRMPKWLRFATSDVVAATVYWPLARTARALERLGIHVDGLPLAAYRERSFYCMRTDALDRFGTRLESRFSRTEIEAMMADAGLHGIRFHEAAPYWCAVGYRSGHAAG